MKRKKRKKRKTPTKGGTTGEDTVSESGVWFLPSSLVQQETPVEESTPAEESTAAEEETHKSFLPPVTMF